MTLAPKRDGPVAEDCDLSEEVPWSERSEVCTLRGDDRAAPGEDEERVTSGSLAYKPLAACTSNQLASSRSSASLSEPNSGMVESSSALTVKAPDLTSSLLQVTSINHIVT